jgi:hypothetical protein
MARATGELAGEGRGSGSPTISLQP